MPRALIVKYEILTGDLSSLIWAFLFVRNLYQIASWNVMMAGGDLKRGRSYCILRGETDSGQTIEVRPIELTDGLYSRTWTMVGGFGESKSYFTFQRCS